jgi:hypothetical protein
MRQLGVRRRRHTGPTSIPDPATDAHATAATPATAARHGRLRRSRVRRAAPLHVGALALCAGLLAACGSSSNASSSPAAKSACQQVGAALSDGPDPDSDPVGYALAQVRPLKAITVSSDSTLQHAIDRLSAAYQTFYNDNGTKAAKSSVNAASKTINSLCPGAGAGI